MFNLIFIFVHYCLVSLMHHLFLITVLLVLSRFSPALSLSLFSSLLPPFPLQCSHNLGHEIYITCTLGFPLYPFEVQSFLHANGKLFTIIEWLLPSYSSYMSVCSNFCHSVSLVKGILQCQYNQTLSRTFSSFISFFVIQMCMPKFSSISLPHQGSCQNNRPSRAHLTSQHLPSVSVLISVSVSSHG